MSAPMPYPTPSPAERTAHNNKTYKALIDDFDLLLSYATTAKESSWRGDGWLLGEEIRQLREGIIQIIQKYKKLDLSEESEKNWRARCAEQSEGAA